MRDFVRSLIRFVLIVLLSLAIGAVFIMMIGENPISAYAALVKGAFVGKLNLGKTLANFTPLMLTALAFAIGAKGGAFNVGVEGEVFLGGIAAAYIGIHWSFLPMPLHLLACFLGAIIVAAMWAFIPGALKAYYGVNEVCSTILLNYVAFYITSYLVSGPMSAGVANAQSDPVADQVKLYQFMKPSSANVGMLIAIVVGIIAIWILNKTTFGYKIRTVGLNASHAEYVGINPKHTFIKTMIFSGILGGIAGCIEILGVHGYFLNNFAANLGFNGMLAALIVKNNLILTPFMAFFLGALKSGALGLQQSTGVPKSIVDTITAVFIIIATMDLLFQFARKRRVQVSDDTAKSEPSQEKEV
jgi:simple sugar transport system permease protein